MAEIVETALELHGLLARGGAKARTLAVMLGGGDA
jgi:hypothetical protein